MTTTFIPLEDLDSRAHLRLVDSEGLAAWAFRCRTRLLVGVAAGAAVLVFGLVSFHVVLSQGQLGLDRLEAQVAKEQTQYQRLRLHVAELEAPDRVVTVAQDRLGMVPAPEVVYLTSRATPSEPSERTGSQAVTHDDSDRSPDVDHSRAWAVVKAALAGHP